MSNKYTASLFDSLKEALTQKPNDSSFKDFMKFEKGKTYVVRLLANVKDPQLTRFHYYQHIWDSVANAKKISVLCPNTYGEKCPIDEHRSKIYATKNEALIKQIGPIRKNEKWLYNAYVINDPSNPSNNGQVKIINVGTQLQKVIQSAIDGDDAAEFGFRIFDLSPEGCNLRIKVEENEGGYATYVSSRFMSASAIEGLEDADAIYDAVHALDGVFTRKSYDEIKSILDVHFLGKEEQKKAATPAEKSDKEFVADALEDMGIADDSTDTTTSESVGVGSGSSADKTPSDDKMDAILKDL